MAEGALDDLDTAMQFVVGVRGTLGAMENRMRAINATNAITEENLSASESRIRDADMAKEMMALVKSQILQQAGTAMLAQANHFPESVLQLLR
jgi:flagellin